MIAKWQAMSNPPDKKEEARRTIDLFVVSVLLDAGAGSAWKYAEKSSGKTFSRSEGLGVASVHMFEDGFFSSDPGQPYRVDGQSFATERITSMLISLFYSSQGAVSSNRREDSEGNASH